MNEDLINGVGNYINPYKQAYSDTCAIKSQQLILNDFGIPVTENQCVQYSIEQGWYTGDGTSMEDVGKLLVDAGIPCTQCCDATVYDLVSELAKGHKIIVGVDSGELWDNGLIEWLEDFFIGDAPDHALIVAGIDWTDPANPQVIVTDPGTGDPAKSYPLEQFMDAWKDSNCMMVSTDVATPTATAAFEVYQGCEGGHLPEVCGIEFDDLTQFQDYSHQIDLTQYGDGLFDAFSQYASLPYQDIIGSSMLTDFGLPPFDIAYEPFTFGYENPFGFDFGGINDWCDWSNSSSNSSVQHQVDWLSDSVNYAQEQAAYCRENDMFVMATLWDQQACETQSRIDDLLM